RWRDSPTRRRVTRRPQLDLLISAIQSSSIGRKLPTSRGCLLSRSLERAGATAQGVAPPPVPTVAIEQERIVIIPVRGGVRLRIGVRRSVVVPIVNSDIGVTNPAFR